MAGMFSLSVRKSDKARKPATISVEEFGSVRNASIDLADFIVLVGRNNTGKSYVANLIWAFRNFRSVVGSRTPGAEIKIPEWLADYIASATVSDAPLVISGAQVAAHLNDWFARNEQHFADKILSYEGSKIKGLKASFSGEIWLWRREKPTEAFEQLGSERAYTCWEIGFSKPSKVLHSSDNYASEGLWGGGITELALFFEIVEIFLNGSRHSRGGSTYLPAARSGLMLSLSSLYSSLLEDLGQIGDDSQTDELPLATTRFLRAMTQRRRPLSARRQHAKIAEFLEREVLKGTVDRVEEAAGRFVYAPAGSAESLPLYVTSSLVSEIAPLLYLLKNGGLHGGLILEEPEAHLHLSAQRSMARAVARIINSGSQVAITTHSDTFIQQINVLGRLYSHPSRDDLLSKYAYTDDDVLDLRKSICYEFIQGKKGTKVRRLRPSAGGFAVESLNETIIDLAEEAIATASDN